jgi:hypothetical protein
MQKEEEKRSEKRRGGRIRISRIKDEKRAVP